MNESDFEIQASLRADELTVHIAPEASVEPEDKRVVVSRQASSRPADIEASETVEDVAVNKQIRGRLKT
jgi:hypothetical protein